MPFRNEAYVLGASLPPLVEICDFVLGIDDNSTDESPQIFESLGGTLIGSAGVDTRWASGGQTRSRRLLLEEARRRGATHHLWIDADEVLSANAVGAVEYWLTHLPRKAKVQFPWVNLLRDTEHYIAGHHLLAPQPKDFLVFDDLALVYGDGLLHFGRTQGPQTAMDETCGIQDGCVLHLQYLWPQRLAAKQSWYRYMELTHTERSARAINRRYAHTKRLSASARTKKVPPGIWPVASQSRVDAITDDSWTWQKQELVAALDTDDIGAFEELDIWDDPDLRGIFQSRTGRCPKSSVDPPLISALLKYQVTHLLYGHVRRGAARFPLRR